MPDRPGGQSRWSSARERQERDRAREAERDSARKARMERANAPPTSQQFSGGKGKGEPQRRLSDDERRTIREYRFPSQSKWSADPTTPAKADAPAIPVTEAAAPSTPVEERPAVSRRAPLGTSTKWRSAVDTASAVPVAPNLPDLPAEPGAAESGGRSRGNNRLIMFGALLFAAMGLAAFLPFGPLGGEADDLPPTPSGQLADISTPAGLAGPAPTAAPTVELVADNERVVCIDPGHGGWDTGWNRSDQSDPPYEPPIFTEAEVNLGLSFMLKEELERNDVTVVMTRVSGGAVNALEEDVNGDGVRRLDFEDPDQSEQAGDRDELQARINVCNESGADVMISVHFNGFDDRSVRGYEIYYTAAPYRPFGDLNAELARLTYRELDTAMRNSEYGGGYGRDALDDTKLDSVQHDFGTEEHLIMTGPAVNTATYTITPSNMPGMIVEGAFLSNDEDSRFIIQPEHQQLMADAYARG
ncbi:MAG: N-acetylmuramoyl-L-alanine amidase, partial [Chloroflexia bacterium]|nr:N-acetylmuramoyl-L-alanine amidase [Chloroflexia bacterium]